MASLQEFVGKISKVPGVRGYLLLKRDGKILSQNIQVPDRLAAMVVICAVTAESVTSAADLSRFRCLVLGRGKKEKFLVFPAMQSFLLVVEKPDTYTLELLKEIEGVIQSCMPL